jgi:hypothetical protein
MEELEQARAARDGAFSRFVEESTKATKHSLKARAARASYMLAAGEMRALERDLLAYEPIIQARYGNK